MTRVLLAIGSRANWASSQSVAAALQRDHDLTVLCYASAVLERYGAVHKLIAERHRVIRVATLLEGGEPEQMAVTAGLTQSSLAHVLASENPDVVYVVGDRYEVLPVAYAAHLLNLRVAHQMGGELSGTVDEPVRHAITKLSHIHFAATAQAARRICQMGEDSAHVYLTGCPRIDLAATVKAEPRDALIVLQHPVTTEWSHAGQDAATTLEGVRRSQYRGELHIFWPNADAGNELAVNALRALPKPFFSHRNLPPETFLRMLAGARCIVGNSSAAIREGAYFGTPAVNVGSRQAQRERGPNVVDVPHDADAIAAAIQQQAGRRFERSELYGSGRACEAISRALAKELPPIQKVWKESA